MFTLTIPPREAIISRSDRTLVAIVFRGYEDGAASPMLSGNVLTASHTASVALIK